MCLKNISINYHKLKLYLNKNEQDLYILITSI